MCDTDSLFNLIESNNSEAVLRAVRANVDLIVTCNELGVPPLQWAIIYRKNDIARMLLDNGADADIRNSEGGNALFPASYNGDIEMVKLLIERGADVHAVSQAGATALHIACYIGKTDIVEMLILSRADVNVADLSGATPLHRAVAANSSECINLLLLAGANVHARNKRGLTAAELACEKRKGEAEAILHAFIDR